MSLEQRRPVRWLFWVIWVKNDTVLEDFNGSWDAGEDEFRDIRERMQMKIRLYPG